MKKRSRKTEAPRYLVSSEFVDPKPNGEDRERAAARRVFIGAVHRLVPRFFETLRKDVYPIFALRMAAMNRIPLRPWKVGADELGSRLLNWAGEFNVDREDWILEGALANLRVWDSYPKSRKTLDWSGFRRLVAQSGLEASSFIFVDDGWDPTFIRGDAWRSNTMKEVEAELDRYLQEERKRALKQGLRAAQRYTPEHFEWLALFQCGKFSLEAILRRYKEIGKAKSSRMTISKGIRRAAAIIGFAHLRTDKLSNS